MNTIDVAAQDAEAALVVLASHLPPHIEIGKPFLAATDPDGQIVIASVNAWWWPSPDNTVRLIELGNGRSEVTTWAAGVETSRVIGRW